MAAARRKKGRRTDAARPAPTKGQYRTAWPTPLSGRGPGCFYTSRTLRFRLVGSDEAVGRLRVDQLVFMAVRSARRVVSSLSNVVWSLIGCPSSKGDRSMLSPARKLQGAKSGRSGAGWHAESKRPIAPWDRLAAGLQPGRPSRYLYATNHVGRKQSPRAPAWDRRRETAGGGPGAQTPFACYPSAAVGGCQCVWLSFFGTPSRCGTSRNAVSRSSHVA